MTNKPQTGANWRSVKRHQVEPALANIIDAATNRLKIRHEKLGVIVTEGPRTHKRQAELKRAGATKTMHSKHIPELSPTQRALAVDIAMTVSGQVRWDWPLYEIFAVIVKELAQETGVKITWGGDWPRFKDGPHYQIEI